MTLRPFKTIRQYKQLVELLRHQIEQYKQLDTVHNKLHAQQKETHELDARMIAFCKTHIAALEKDITLLKAACISHSDPQLRDGEIEPPATKKYIN